MKALIFRETGEPKSVLKLAEIYSAFGPWLHASSKGTGIDLRCQAVVVRPGVIPIRRPVISLNLSVDRYLHCSN